MKTKLTTALVALTTLALMPACLPKNYRGVYQDDSGKITVTVTSGGVVVANATGTLAASKTMEGFGSAFNGLRKHQAGLYIVPATYDPTTAHTSQDLEAEGGPSDVYLMSPLAGDPLLPPGYEFPGGLGISDYAAEVYYFKHDPSRAPEDKVTDLEVIHSTDAEVVAADLWVAKMWTIKWSNSETIKLHRIK